MATKEGVKGAGPVILEPVMRVDVSAPLEFQGTLIANLTRRKGVIVATETIGKELICLLLFCMLKKKYIHFCFVLFCSVFKDDYVAISAEVGLSKMFGYSTDIRSQTEGKGEFSMEYVRYAPIQRDEQEELIHERERAEQEKNK